MYHSQQMYCLRGLPTHKVKHLVCHDCNSSSADVRSFCSIICSCLFSCIFTNLMRHRNTVSCICRNAGFANGTVMGRLTLNLAGFPEATAPCSQDTALAAPASLSRSASATASAPLKTNFDSSVSASQGKAIAAAIAAIYPFVQLLPVTAKVWLSYIS